MDRFLLGRLSCVGLPMMVLASAGIELCLGARVVGRAETIPSYFGELDSPAR